MNRHNSSFTVKDSHSRLRRRRALVAQSKLKAGKRTKEWTNTRRKLVKEYAKRGITTCELRYENCWHDTGLGFAHGRKRRHLREGELKELTILACNPCHDAIEYLGPERMLQIVEETISKRDWGLIATT